MNLSEMTFSQLFSIDIIHSMFRCAVPILYAAMAAVISKQANVFNIAIEGTMLFSAFAAASISYFSHSWFIALVVAVIIGVLVSAILAVANIKYKANVVVIGFSINLLGTSVTRFLMYEIFGTYGTFDSPEIVELPKLDLEFLAKNPIIDSLFNKYSLFEILAIPLFLVVWFMLYRTRWGIRLRSVGLNEMAAATAGINVDKRKYQAILISGVLAGIAGAHLSIGYSSMFVEGMTNGRGFMGVAAMNFGGAHPVGAFLASLLFGLSEAIGMRLQSFGFPSFFVLMMPYVITVVVLIVAMAYYTRQDKKRRSTTLRVRAKG